MPGTRLTIDITEGGASPRGRISDEQTGASRRFLGWLGLLAALDALMPPDPPRDGEPPERRLP